MTKQITVLVALAAALVAAACGSVNLEPDGGGSADASVGIDGASADAGGTTDADPCDGVTCECETDAQCGLHEFCDTSGAGRVCACVAGYTGDPCVWGGAPMDPGFQNGTLWTVSNGAAISPLSTGNVSPGEMLLNPTSQCNLGRVSQTFVMPPYDKAEPFVAEVTYQSTGGGTSGQYGAAIGFNRAWQALAQANSGWSTVRTCLGEAAYGGEVEFQASTDIPQTRCGSSPTGTLSVDHFEVKVANPGECPAPGSALNGDAEAAGGWEFTASGTSVAGIAENVGNNGSRGARFVHGQRCSIASMTMTFSVPSSDSMASPALEFWWRGTNGARFPASLNGSASRELSGTGGVGTEHYCLPAAMKGGIGTMAFRANTGSGLCNEEMNWELVIDDVRIVNDPACGADEDLFDPGFESAPAPLLEQSKGSQQWQQINMLSDAGLAHSGQGVLEFVQQTFCNSTTYTNRLFIPEPNGADGPALKFWSNVPAGAATTARYFGPGFSANLPTGGGWRLNTVCLPPVWSNRWLPFGVGVSGGSGGCNTDNGNVDRFYFDDYQLGTDSACPAN